jgi:hypothetical protein
MATCKKMDDGDDCDRNYRNRKIVEECPKNKADIEMKKPVYDPKETRNRCLSALGD